MVQQVKVPPLSLQQCHCCGAGLILTWELLHASGIAKKI